MTSSPLYEALTNDFTRSSPFKAQVGATK